MTTVYIGERQSGKTTTLIEMSEKDWCDYRRGHLFNEQIYSNGCGSDG